MECEGRGADDRELSQHLADPASLGTDCGRDVLGERLDREDIAVEGNWVQTWKHVAVEELVGKLAVEGNRVQGKDIEAKNAMHIAVEDNGGERPGHRGKARGEG